MNNRQTRKMKQLTSRESDGNEMTIEELAHSPNTPEMRLLVTCRVDDIREQDFFEDVKREIHSTCSTLVSHRFGGSATHRMRRIRDGDDWQISDDLVIYPW